MPKIQPNTTLSLNTLILIAIFIRILLAPFFFHPDMKSQHFHFQFLSLGHLNIYQYIADNKIFLPYKDTFNYLPLTYFTFGTIQAILKPLMPADFQRWINDWGSTQNNYVNLPYFLLILKLPYILLDFGIFWLILKITKSYKISIFWLFNPISFYLIYILGNFDILPVFFTLLSFYLLKDKPHISFLVLGIAIALKLYPLLFLPFYLFSLPKNLKKYIIYVLLALLPLLLSILPFTLNSAFWHSFFGSGLTQKIIEYKIFNTPVFPLIYLAILGKALFSKNLDLSKYLLYIFLLFISLVHFHPQWLLWFYPYLLLLDKNILFRFQFIFLLLFALIFSYIVIFNDNFLFWGHLLPIDMGFLLNTSPYDIIRHRLLIDPQIIQNHLKTSIVVISSVIFILYEKNIYNHHP
jgi:hypothetical protein